MFCLLASNSPFQHRHYAVVLGRSLQKHILHSAINRQFSKKPLPRITLDEKDIEETFCRGSGPGGQKINKSTNKVRLRHVPTGATVAVQEQRGLATNRSLARKLLRDKVDLILNGADSRISKGILKKQKRKMKSAGRSKKKYEKDGSVELSATDAAGEVIHSASDDDSDGEFDDDEEDEDVDEDEDDKEDDNDDKGVPEPVP